MNMEMKAKSIILSLVLLLGIAFVFSGNVKADDSSGGDTTRTGTSLFGIFRSQETTEVKESSMSSDDSESPEPSETPRVKGVDKLLGNRLQFCENHQDEINNRLTSLGNLVANILGKFDAIAVRVEDYYTNTVEPSGKTVPNYDVLVADITSKKDAVNTALSNVQADINGFSCNADNPKAQIRLYRTDMQTVKSALNDYKISIKNLIVAVRSVVGETESTSTPSPTTTATPTPTP